ncbi:hypothetical protein PG989_003791 [Apiospora arundinis]
MDNSTGTPFHSQRNRNSALAVGGPSSRGRTMAEHLGRLHGQTPSQEDTHPTLASLVKDSDPLVPVDTTIDHADQNDTSSGPGTSSVIAAPVCPRHRPRASRGQIAHALQAVPANYAGNLMASDNLSARIPYHQNCSLFVRNLPPELTYEQFFAALRGVGRMDRAAAQRLKEKIDKEELVIDGFTANALWNKIRVAAQPEPSATEGGGSRVVRVTGSPNIVNTEYLLSYFAAHFHFDLDGAPKVVHRDYDSASIEFAFAAFVNQAENAYRLLRQDRHGNRVFGHGSGRGRGWDHGPGLGGRGGIAGRSNYRLSVAYVQDPCEVDNGNVQQ